MEECPPLTVEGDWSPDQNRTAKNKLKLYFQSRKKSGGGECRVESEDGAPRAAVFFSSEEVRERVLNRSDHQIILDGQNVTLRVRSAAKSTNSDDVSGSLKESKSEDENGASAADTDDCSSAAVVLENVPDGMSRDLLSMLVENVSGVDENGYSLEMILESSRAVVTFSSPQGTDRFLSESRTSTKVQKHRLTVRPLEAATRVRLENLPQTAIKDLLEMFFEKNFALPADILMIPEERAAVVSFSHHKAVQNICIKEDLVICSNSVKVYPFYPSLGTALYGKDRPAWKMPDSFTESLHPVVRKFLLMKNLLKSINDQMRPHFCSVDLDQAEVKLSPLPGFLRQNGLTAQQVDGWERSAQDAFRRLMAQYSAFECQANGPAWKVAEKDVRSILKEDGVPVLDASRGVLTVAGQADDMKRIRPPVENIVVKAMSVIERQTNGVSELMPLSPAMFYILKQDGLLRATQDISPDMNLSYNEATQQLTITGLPAEVYKTKAWILERNMNMSKKQLSIPPCLLDFLRTVDPTDMSQDLFTSQGISAIYSIEIKGVFLLGSSDKVLADADTKMKEVLALQTLDVEDQEVMRLPGWMDLKQQLLDTYNSTKKKTVDIQTKSDKVTVAGFRNPVREVSSSLKEFITNFSRVQETVRVDSCAVVQFIDKKKTQDWSSISKDNNVSIQFDPERPRIVLAGARLHVQKARSCFQQLTSALATDILTVDKPGAKKYFQTSGRLFLSSIMTEFNCVVVLRPEGQDEDEEEIYEGGSSLCYCKVKTTSGVLVSVSRADICSFDADAVVNAANEDLQHIGGLALALLKAAGPELQKTSSDYVTKNGPLRPGDAMVTDAYNLPCKYVVHAVGPRFSNYDKKTSVSRLKTAVKESLRQAETVSCSSVALPAISSGVFGFPVQLCAETIAQAVREYCDGPRGQRSLTEVHLVDNNDGTVRDMAAAVNAEFSDLQPTMTVPPPTSRGTGASGGSQRGGGRGRGRGRGGRGGGGGRGAGLQANRGGLGRPGERRAEQITAEGLKMVLCLGNIEEQKTDAIVNTISENMDLHQGTVSRAILEAAGRRLQAAVRSAVTTATLRYGYVIITDGFDLSCQKVFHAVCPPWDGGNGRAEENLVSIVRFCLVEAEKLRFSSLSFPAIGTGNLSFPRDLVSRVLLREVHWFSRTRTPQHLREVHVVVHPSDSQTVESFSREFKAPNKEVTNINASPIGQPVGQSQPSAASFSLVSSPSLGVYRMQMGQVTLEVSSGDITKEASDVIVNSSNQDFTLKSGVSKAILDAAGPVVELECSQMVNSPGFQSRPLILTSAGRLPCRGIIHIVGQNDPGKIKEMVYSVLKTCEVNKFSSVCFPALGTGQGGVPPSAVADAMIDAVVEFVRKKQPKFVHSVKILIFQTVMIAEFHRSMKRRQGEEVEEKSVLAKIKDSFTSLFSGFMDEQPSIEDLVLEREEFEPTVFQLCADNHTDVSLAKKRITELIVAEQAERKITDPYISQLSPANVEELKALQKQLTVSIWLDQEQEPSIHLEGLTRDVYTAESAVRDLIRRVERAENLKSKALQVSKAVEWKFQDHQGVMVAFDMFTNLKLEEALEKRQNVKVQIGNRTFTAYPAKKEATDGIQVVELQRSDMKNEAALPSHWDDMKGDLVKLFDVPTGSQEYKDVKKEMNKTGLTANIISVQRVQNTTLFQNYQLMKKQLEVKNKHKNNERLLFHGTGSNAIDLINKQGFNRSYAGAHGDNNNTTMMQQ
uniref:Poly [ADP-ribose] polymerase n=1 Tax=Acanthochromis polyacanthus TaxID=80966 RepID=A0A3Q1FWA0_9TELE